MSKKDINKEQSNVGEENISGDQPEEQKASANPRPGMKIETPRNKTNNNLKKNKIRSYISNIIVLVVLAGITYYLVKNYTAHWSARLHRECSGGRVHQSNKYKGFCLH